MADEGTFLGEIQRGWQRFWLLSWWWKAPAISFVALILLTVAGGIAGGGSDDKKSDSQVRTTATVSATATATATPVATKQTASPTATLAPTATPQPTIGPTPVPTPKPTTTPFDMVQQLKKSYKDNQNFMIRASADGLNVQWAVAGLPSVWIEIKPKTVLTEGDYLTIAAQSALIASRAIWATYPEVQDIELTVLGDFTDQFGVSMTETAASIGVWRETGEKIQYDGMRDLVYADNKHLFCVADYYYIHEAIYYALGDEGCLSTWGPLK